MKRYCTFTLQGGARVTEQRTHRSILINETNTPTEHYGWQERGYFFFKSTGDTYCVKPADVVPGSVQAQPY